MAALASASKSFAFGWFKAYTAQRVAPMRVELSRDFKFQNDQLALKVVERWDGTSLIRLPSACSCPPMRDEAGQGRA